MECNCIIELNFDSIDDAKMAEIVLKSQMTNNKRSVISRSIKDSTLNVKIEAKDFTALRAMATSTFRDLRVFIDAKSISK